MSDVDNKKYKEFYREIKSLSQSYYDRLDYKEIASMLIQAGTSLCLGTSDSIEEADESIVAGLEFGIAEYKIIEEQIKKRDENKNE